MLQRLNDYGNFVQYNKISALFGGLRHQTNVQGDIESTQKRKQDFEMADHKKKVFFMHRREILKGIRAEQRDKSQKLNVRKRRLW